MIQGILAGLALIIAATYLGRQVYVRLIKKDPKCDSCAFGKDALEKN